MAIKSRFPFYVRTTAMVLLVAMFHYVAGYRLMYSLGILYAKEEAKECLSEKNNNIQKLTLSASDYSKLKWSEESKEFSFNNEMYDIVSVQQTGTYYVLTVYSDNNETEWLTAFHNFEKELFHPDQSNKGAKSAEDVMSAFQKDCTPASEFTINIYALAGLIYPAVAIQQHPLQISDNIWHPPTSC